MRDARCGGVDHGGLTGLVPWSDGHAPILRMLELGVAALVHDSGPSRPPDSEPSCFPTGVRTRGRVVPRLVIRLVVVGALLALVGLRSFVVPSPAGAVTGQYWTGKLQLSKVWKITRGAGVTVAVVDSGVPRTGDLGSRLLPGRSFAIGSDNARIDPGVSTGGIGGTYSHGQNMAELIAGDGSSGLVGIAPQARILPVKVALSTGQNIPDSAVAQGIRYAVDQGVQVVNASVGAVGGCTSAVGAAVKYAYQHDIIVVVSSGDSGLGQVDTPANCPGALAVSGIDSNARPWSGSNYGPEVDVTNFAKDIPGVSSTGGQGPTNGTSAAAAFTSGEVALLRAAYPHDSARAIVTRLLYGIDNLTTTLKNGTRVNDHVGYGVPVPLDALKDTVPSTAPDPIYDRLLKELGPGSGNSAPGATAPRRSQDPDSGPSNAPGVPPSNSAGGRGGNGVAVWIGAGVLLVVIIGVGFAVSRTRRRLRGGGPPPPGYGSPPPGYGPPDGHGPPPRYGPPGR
jgi:hypothetical protein